MGDSYSIKVTGTAADRWQWEILRNGAPLPIRMRDGPFKSKASAKIQGKSALREFLRLLKLEGEA
jgi:hypothetical protein